MSAYKQFLTQDIIVSPFEVNKSFTFTLDTWSDPDVQIDRFLGQNIQSPYFISGSNTPTGDITLQDPELIYNSTKELYYSNFISGSYGSPVQTQSLFPGDTPSGDVYVGNSDSVGRYFNYLQTTNTIRRYFPTGSDDKIAVLSIPSGLYGDLIEPGSWVGTFVDPGNGLSYTCVDDGEGNVYQNGTYVGNIIYPHGIVIFTNLEGSTPIYGGAEYGVSIYGGSLSFDDIVTTTNATMSFSSSYTIYETQYKATIRENEFNFSLNPSLISGSTDGTVYDYVTGSYFSPYVTTVGLYDDLQNLLAIGKLSQPLPTSRTTDTTIFINIDR
jgi:hypothetical protein